MAGWLTPAIVRPSENCQESSSTCDHDGIEAWAGCQEPRQLSPCRRRSDRRCHRPPDHPAPPARDQRDHPDPTPTLRPIVGRPTLCEQRPIPKGPKGDKPTSASTKSRPESAIGAAASAARHPFAVVVKRPLQPWKRSLPRHRKPASIPCSRLRRRSSRRRSQTSPAPAHSRHRERL
jgi:hypothetical protein